MWTWAIGLPVAAIAGDLTTCVIGRRIGPAPFNRCSTRNDSRFFKKRHVTEWHEFFDNYGQATTSKS
jgi:membrane-associated protein